MTHTEFLICYALIMTNKTSISVYSKLFCIILKGTSLPFSHPKEAAPSAATVRLLLEFLIQWIVHKLHSPAWSHI